MIYTDRIHLVADSLAELHEFAKEVSISRNYFEGVRKGHPHYDLPAKKRKALLSKFKKEFSDKVSFVRPQQVLLISKKMK